MMNGKNISLIGLILCLLLPLFLNSCDNTVEALKRKKGLYSIYGALNMDSKTNYIRIKNLNIPLVFDTLRSLNASVRLKNLKTGRSQLLTEDSVVIFDGVYTHNFKTTLPINPATTYKVTVKRHSDGFKETVKVKTPIRTPVIVSPPVDSCADTLLVTFRKALPGETIEPVVVFQKYKNLKTKTGKETITYHPGTDKNIIFGENSPPHLVAEQYNMRNLLINLFYSGKFSPPIPDHVCAGTLTSPKVTIFYAVYGPVQTIQQDSLHIPGGIGELVGFYTDSVSFTIYPFNF